MKLNWGTGIVMSFLAFIAFILYFVVIASTDEQADHDLVSDQYYQEELAYQKEIDAYKNTRALNEKLKLHKTPAGMLISFPQHFNPNKIKGIVSLYRPSNKHLDFDLPLSLSNSHLLIPDKRLLDGRWDIKISWEYQGKAYLQKEGITYYKDPVTDE